ncbi:MAG: OFA family MFS transporter, partial [Clostridiales bacterium]|nr:OFA family MFS transporter [Clostridiales bacterium]
MYSKKAIGPITGCLVVMLCVGIIYLWSVFSGDIIKAFNWNASSAKMVSSYMLMGFVIGCLIGGILNDKKGPRFTCTLGIILFSLGIGSTAFLTSGTISLIYLTYSLMGGLGSGLAYNAAIPCVQKWMPGRRGLASGIAAAAFGLSTLIVTPISKALMVRFTKISGIVDFKPVFLILSGLFLVIGLIACMFVCTPPVELGLSNGAKNKVFEKNYSLKEATNTVPFWCLFATMFFINATWTLTVPLIKDLGQMRGLTEAAAIFAVSFTGVPNALGRLLMATLSDKIGRMNTLLILSAGTLVAALLMAVAVGYW